MQDIRAAVEGEFAQVNRLIIDQLHSDVPMVENIGHYIVDAGGKRLRPLLTLLCAAALERCEQQHITFAAIIEFIHTATLLHDDVVDISSLRRGRPTANAEFGNAPSVLVGDFLYTRAFQLMVGLQDMTILRHMADTTNTIAEGEVLQLARAGDPDTSEAQYLEVITRKTAVLFEAACYGAAVLSKRPEPQRQQLGQFGRNLGIAFQMIDDMLDYQGDPASMGKNVGDDLVEGKATLPLIHTMQNANTADAKLVREALRNKAVEALPEVLAAVQRNGSVDYTHQQACLYHDRALAQLDALKPSAARDALEAVTALSIRRNN